MVLTCSTQTFVVMIWFFRFWKRKQKGRAEDRIISRRHSTVSRVSNYLRGRKGKGFIEFRKIVEGKRRSRRSSRTNRATLQIILSVYTYFDISYIRKRERKREFFFLEFRRFIMYSTKMIDLSPTFYFDNRISSSSSLSLRDIAMINTITLGTRVLT